MASLPVFAQDADPAMEAPAVNTSPGPEYADATPLLRTHIANLRRKLHACVEGEIIKTYRGAGYLFDAKVTRA